MTKLAIISDLHADVHALRDALMQIDQLGIDQIVCAGDVVDYGCFPDETIALLQTRSIPTIRGNHDRWAISGDRAYSGGWDLAASSIAFLRSLPTSWSAVIDGVRIEVHHARPRNDMNGIDPDAPSHELESMLDDIGAQVMIVGHTHTGFARRLGRDRLVANPGALLRDPAPGVDIAVPGTFGILTIERGGRVVEFEVRRPVDGEVVRL